MKKIWVLAIFSVMLVVLLISTPVAAAPPANYTITPNGIEIFAGIICGNTRYGATFVAPVLGTDGTNGVLSASVNYQVPNPVANGSNTIVGGTWTLTITTKGETGTIMGKITKGYVNWADPNFTGSGTAVGTTHMDLSITGGTGNYKKISGTGSFDGNDNHLPGINVFGTVVPTVNGTLALN